ncbi:GNAT family N-acetyltransferase [Morganella psychrotolerans]|uniref:N-acetyltransferase domain-containing protein n=1 Tax=Morganella psychrotolerans TaxID=368603 RepID=A0A1B8H544_9GAMM|nr:GNAT family N-acetyltransferase [Morganella psychrotolerans]OBU04163.1 hypothetical protein AYY18_09455 [Morganella psychrotolerans]
MTPILETKRLLLTPLSMTDAGEMQRIFPTWETVKYLNADTIPWPYPENGAEDFIQHVVIPDTLAGNGFFWAIKRKENPEKLIGVIDLHLDEEFNRGFWLSEAWRGRGFTSEASESVNEFWFDVLGMDKLTVSKACDNIASSKISESNGMILTGYGYTDYICGTLKSEVWEMTKETRNLRKKCNG